MSTTTAPQVEHETTTEAGLFPHLNPTAFGAAAAAISALVMLLLGIAGTVGVYEGAVEMMVTWHMFFEPTVVGTLGGIIEAAIIAFVFTYAFAWVYNVLADRPGMSR
ncbi:hypothetical protein [Haloarchaeobius sp. TZWSO28]|uniref:hypothetical protein n=1 Tax=unclassified Haloarchaeobius TaxID=2614452 RepID=UPI003EBF4063